MLKYLRGTVCRALLAVCLGLASGVVVAAEKLRGVQISADLQGTHLVLDLSGKVRYTTQTLANPDRLVIDLRDTRNAANLKGLALQETAVQGIRSGIRNGDDLRLVLDLAGPSTAKATADGNRLLIELRERGRRKAAARTEPPPTPTAKADAADAAAVSAQASKPAKSSGGGLRDIVIVIDAGHGGHDTGAVGPNRAIEKHVTLAIARELAAILERERGYRAVLTRSKDLFIPLKQRAVIARKAQADLFVSVHADAFTDASARGASVFALSDRGATSTMAAFLAAEANKSDQIGGVSTAGKNDELVKVLADLSMTSSMDTSMRIGGRILAAMDTIGNLHSRRVEQAGFMVLKSPDTPSLLVETGFISNPGEARLLTSPDYQRQMANAIFSGIHRYFSQTPPPNTYLAAARDNRASEQALANAEEGPGGR